MKLFGAVLFAAGILLAVRVMFFGVRLRAPGDEAKLRSSRLAVAAVLLAIGSLVYARALAGWEVTAGWLAIVVVAGALAAMAAWWVVRASATAGSDDPDDDPRYRMQGFVARVVVPIPASNATGRIALVVDGNRLELSACWLPEHTGAAEAGAVDREVVIEHVDGDLAYVEPWAVVERRL